MIHFRPLPAMSLLAVVALGVLIWLGLWQLDRAEWKRGLMQDYEARGEVAGFAAALCEPAERAFSPSIAAPAPLAGAELRLYTVRGEPGWLRLSAIPAPRCADPDRPRYLLVERGFEPLRGGELYPTRRWRLAEMTPGDIFSAPNAPEANEWHVFDRPAMEAALSLEAGDLLEVWARSDEIIPAGLSRTTPATHIGYALTWLGLGATLIGVYIAFHMARGRLRFGRSGPGDDETSQE